MIKTKGFKEFSKYLDEQSRVLNDPRDKVKMLIKAGKIIAERAAQIVRKRTGRLSRHVFVLRDKREEQLEGDVAVAITTTGKGWYGHLIEYGHGNAQAYPFMRPALDEKEKEALSVLAEEVEKRL